MNFRQINSKYEEGKIVIILQINLEFKFIKELRKLLLLVVWAERINYKIFKYLLAVNRFIAYTVCFYGTLFVSCTEKALMCSAKIHRSLYEFFHSLLIFCEYNMRFFHFRYKIFSRLDTQIARIHFISHELQHFTR